MRLLSEKTEVLYAELIERVEAATSLLQYIYLVINAKNYQKI